MENASVSSQSKQGDRDPLADLFSNLPENITDKDKENLQTLITSGNLEGATEFVRNEKTRFGWSKCQQSQLLQTLISTRPHFVSPP